MNNVLGVFYLNKCSIYQTNLDVKSKSAHSEVSIVVNLMFSAQLRLMNRSINQWRSPGRAHDRVG